MPASSAVPVSMPRLMGIHMLLVMCATALCALTNLVHGALTDPLQYSCSVSLPSFSQHTCFGQTADMRACRFRNLFYNTSGNGTWHYFESPNDPPEVKLSGQSSVSFDFQQPPPTGSSNITDAYFFSRNFVRAMSHELPSGWADGAGMGMEVHMHRTQPPAQAQVLMQSGVSLLWNFFDFSTYSYGHCLLNDWLPMWLVMSFLFPESIPPFKVLMKGPHAPEVCLHYIAPFSRRAPAVTFASLVAEAKQAGKPWIRFCDLVAGDGGYQLITINAVSMNSEKAPLTPPPVFNAGNWHHFRQAVYRAHGINSAHVFNSNQRSDGVHTPHVTVINTGRRRILNAVALVEHLKLELPHANVSLVNFQKLDPEAQLQVMARTSLFITTQGSASFRHVFLNRGASVILIGSPLYAHSAEVFGYSPFFEIPELFQVADYKIIKYPMDPAAPEYNVSSPINYHHERWDMYSVNVMLNISRMTTFVHSALHEVARSRQWLLDVDAD